LCNLDEANDAVRLRAPRATLLNIFEEAEKNGTLANVTFMQGAAVDAEGAGRAGRL